MLYVTDRNIAAAGIKNWKQKDMKMYEKLKNVFIWTESELSVNLQK